jgi:hypothetical protein
VLSRFSRHLSVPILLSVSQISIGLGIILQEIILRATVSAVAMCRIPITIMDIMSIFGA